MISGLSRFSRIRCRIALPQKSESFLDRVSTGSASDLVRDQHAIFPKDFDSQGSSRSLPLPVLTDRSADPFF